MKEVAMKRSCIFTSALILGGSVAVVSGQTPAPTTPSIVTLNFNAAVLATGEAQQDLGALQKKFAPREIQLQKLNDSVEAERKQLRDNSGRLGDSERAAKLQDLNAKDKQLQREAEDFKNDSQSESQQVFQRIAQKLYEVLQDYSKKHGYSAVIERGTDSAPIVWYAANSVDITEQIAKAYDLRSGISSSGLPEKPAPGIGAPSTQTESRATQQKPQ
jgi:outer membrane protein